MERIRKIFGDWRVLALVIVLGLAARLAMAAQGESYDIKSWFIVADITGQGGNVYAETSRYNYGPVWFLVLHVLDVLSRHHHAVLRYLIAAVLSLVDLGIFWVLWRMVGGWAGALFFLNPIAILISGFHGQFDNLAVLIALCAVRVYGDDHAGALDRRKIGGLLLLGLSLMTKHLFFAFPLWLAVKQHGLWRKAVVLFLPVLCFLFGFVPFWHSGSDGILLHVFSYVPVTKLYFYQVFVPYGIQRIWNGESLWYMLLMVFAFICRTRNGLESVMVYTGALVAFSACTANQYLAIPVAFTAVYPNPFSLLYVVLGTIHVYADPLDGPHLFGAVRWHYDKLAVCALVLAVVWHLWRPQLVQLGRRILREIEIQFGRNGVGPQPD
jgi:uncharacterized protein Usg